MIAAVNMRGLIWRTALALAVFTSLTATKAKAITGADCHLSVTTLNFGEYTSLATRPSDFTATISILCTTTDEAPVPIKGSIDLMIPGQSTDPNLENGGQRLRYQIYMDAARSIQWRSGLETAGFSGAVSASTPFRQNLTIYGRIPARQTGAGVGPYRDTISVILNY
jgi:spore coat protein U-like protein